MAKGYMPRFSRGGKKAAGPGRGSRPNLRSITATQVLSVMADQMNGITQTESARKHGVSNTVVRGIWNGLTYRDITGK